MKKIIALIFTLFLAAGIQSAFAQSAAISSISDQPQVHTTQVNQTTLNAKENSSISEQKPTSVKQADKTKTNGSSNSKEAISSVSEVKGAPVSKVSVNKVAATSGKQPSSVD